ncbi:uncharacterized protein METZ01_LOCUS80578, partial [marine metagenome]
VYEDCPKEREVTNNIRTSFFIVLAFLLKLNVQKPP